MHTAVGFLSGISQLEINMCILKACSENPAHQTH